MVGGLGWFALPRVMKVSGLGELKPQPIIINYSETDPGKQNEHISSFFEIMHTILGALVLRIYSYDFNYCILYFATGTINQYKRLGPG